MAGITWFRRGKHWTRLPTRAELPAETGAALIRALCRLAERPISDSSTLEDRRNRERQLHAMRLQLLNAVVMARHYRQEAAAPAATPKDTERQLKAMLKLGDTGLAKAVEDCDARTHAAIEAAKNAIWLTPKAKWVPSDDPDAMLGTNVLAPETIRRAVEIALAKEQAQDTKRGPKEKAYQLELARACCEVWSEHKPAGAHGRPAFIRTAFEAAGMPLSDKSLEAFAAQVAPTRTKRGRNK
ncbi:hypothetical protein JF55_05855 [Pseudomonas sp. 1-7]|nr:hypothetical protein JF55_05855 [Pseudomonas sp. 1-7]